VESLAPLIIQTENVDSKKIKIRNYKFGVEVIEHLREGGSSLDKEGREYLSNLL
jgi:hypothetical protein